jgi:hypothetical protein
MVRKLDIETWCRNWDITDNTVDIINDEECVLDDELSKIFGIARTKNGKIVYLYEHTLNDRIIISAKNNKKCLEQCLFTHGEHTFSGDFIDALVYIKHQLDKQNG